jgi:hypothetical protein
VVEEAAELDFTPPDSFDTLERRDYGDTQTTFLRTR